MTSLQVFINVLDYDSRVLINIDKPCEWRRMTVGELTDYCCENGMDMLDVIIKNAQAIGSQIAINIDHSGDR